MLTHHPNNELALLDPLPISDSNSQKAWHLLSLLLSIGRPISLHELATRCTLFPATPEFVQYLCSVSNSPITLIASTDEGILVSVSVLGLLAFQRFASNFNLIDALFARIDTPCVNSNPQLLLKDDVTVYFRKRKQIEFDSPQVDKKRKLSVSKRFRSDFSMVHFHATEHSSRNENVYITPLPNLILKTLGSEFIYQLKNLKKFKVDTDKYVTVDRNFTVPELDEESVYPLIVLDSEDDCQEAKVGEMDLISRMDVDATLFKDDFVKNGLVSVSCENGDDTCNDAHNCFIETTGVVCKEVELFTDSGNKKRELQCSLRPISVSLLDMPKESESKLNNELTPLDKEHLTTRVKSQTKFPTELECGSQKKKSEPSAKLKLVFDDAMSPRQQSVDQSLEGSKVVTTPKENRQVKRNLIKTSKGQKPKQKPENMHIKEDKKDSASFSHADKLQSKDLPLFELYNVEEEEGSGGYGTVYRARRKSDGTTVAIKCPHAKAHKLHLINEQRMLEQFGGKNFVIKYEGCFKSGDSECFVLEHVDHDRPEVLKKDIDLFQLRWYGYCMFRALASLHKQGVVHRDVKPGNFLFSRKLTKGYLIDFNLAMDLHQKYGTTYKLKTGNDASLKPTTFPNAKSAAPTKPRRFPVAKSLGAVKQEATKGSKPTLESNNAKRRVMNRPKADDNLNGWNIMRSQGADGSGITSVKDVTSTRTPSAERLREPLPSQGRKELINLLQETLHSPSNKASSIPASMRKRIAAPPRKVDERLLYPTPMPVHSTGCAKDGKPKKEGPCVGTKGFRAPEVLFRSTHQGPKIDIWSAGVTLLYLMIGRTPFYGDPEQNIKDIAKLRGSEDLWEVSKLHDRESSFPAELYNVAPLPSIPLREWCKINMKRRDFLNEMPGSLFDLVDKCLIVNPRLRISAEDALKHEFFGPCHESLRKQRQLRQVPNLDSGTSLALR
ncbi:uncharacterized protein LOC126679245 [Mercurialis annua]|uniref:uncharacterized protein LOC126679245 n=1 Tax=Mercurialis annua TaxID=3986 RepID=UPI00215E88DE|nr:uncharacterized protein LOC126679245 [Mercurialis annua]